MLQGSAADGRSIIRMAQLDVSSSQLGSAWINMAMCSDVLQTLRHSFQKQVRQSPAITAHCSEASGGSKIAAADFKLVSVNDV